MIKISKFKQNKKQNSLKRYTAHLKKYYIFNIFANIFSNDETLSTKFVESPHSKLYAGGWVQKHYNNYV